MRTLRILVVEDDTLVGELLAETLVTMGHDVCALETTQDGAVAAARRHRPDLMIVDLHLAIGSGISAVDSVILGGPVPHIFISGRPLGQGQRDAELLLKPFRLPELELAIERAVRPSAVDAPAKPIQAGGARPCPAEQVGPV